MKRVFRVCVVTLTAVATLSSCVSNKDMIYFQGIDEIYSNPKVINTDYGLTIQTDDELAISVTSKDKELISPFNNATVINSGAGWGTGGGTSTSMTYFYVDKDGTINFPILGKQKVAGKTIEQVSNEIQAQLRAQYIGDAVVTTKIMSFKVTVMGDVSSPGTQTYTGQRLTVMEALGMAGDLTNTAVRKNVLVMREENGKRVTHRIDLTDPNSVFESPVYYLQQNDLVYVEGNKSNKVKGTTTYTYLTVTGTLLSLVTSIISIVLALD